jgi:hypothetical protein
VLAEGRQDALNILRIGGNDGFSSAQRSFDDGKVDDIVMPRAAREMSDHTCLRFAHWLNHAEGEQARQACLPGSAPPRLRENGRRYRGQNLLGKEPGMQSPQPAVITLRGEKRSGVVSHAFQADFRFRSDRRSPSKARARARPLSSSSGVSAP